MKRYTVMGVDPGKTGAAVILEVIKYNVKGVEIESGTVFRGDELVNLLNFLVQNNSTIHAVVLEEVGAFSGQGVKSTFNFGAAYGAAKIICDYVTQEEYYCQMFEPRPIEWQDVMLTEKVFKEVKHGCQKFDTKKSSLLNARILVSAMKKQDDGSPYEEETVLLDAMKRQKDDGVADALLMAVWGAMQL